MARFSGKSRTAPWLVVCLLLLTALGSCSDVEKRLAGDYKLTYMSSAEVRIWRPDRPSDHRLAVMLKGNVRQYAVHGPYIAGFADTKWLDLSAEPDARTGYFLIDTRSDEIVYGLDEERWRKELQQIGWTKPSLTKLRRD